ncbi:Uncharacterised protein [Mycobacteroides abscessus subsp. abscessus]|nr:Uncharacterised protein [Mycobacteroides abscessus subsp. abscessus]
MDEGGYLPLRGLDHARMAMAGAHHTDSRGEIQVFAVCFVVQIATLASRRHHWGGLLENG